MWLARNLAEISPSISQSINETETENDSSAGQFFLMQSECLSNIIRDMPSVETPTSRVPKVDPLLSGAAERVREAAAELERLGIANRDGIRIRKDLHKDMYPDADRDFGG